MDLEVLPLSVLPFTSLSTRPVSPAAAAKVGMKSSCAQTSLTTEPGAITPGHRMRQGTRKPPSQFVAFSPLNGVAPPSGQVMTGPVLFDQTWLWRGRPAKALWRDCQRCLQARPEVCHSRISLRFCFGMVGNDSGAN
jgi:hypothetical protein